MEQSLVAYSDVERMGATIAKSGLFGVKTVEQAVALMLIAQAEGKHPATAAQEYHVIQGRAALKADQMLARFQNAGGSIKWVKRTDTEASAEFSHPQGGTLTITWTMDRAKKADLAGKENWKKYPAQMLSARVISEGVRAVFPAACGSFYTPEEVQDFTPIQKEPEQPAVVIEEKTETKKPKATPAEKTAVAEAVKRTEKILEKIQDELVASTPKLAADVQAVMDAAKVDLSVMLKDIDTIEMFGSVEELDEWQSKNLTAIKALSKSDFGKVVEAGKSARKNLTAKKGRAA